MSSILTFSPPKAPSFDFPLRHEYPASRISAIKPYVQVIRKSLRPWRSGLCEWKSITRDELDYILSFFHEVGPVFFNWTPPDPVVSAPLHRAADLDEITATGAPASSRTYYVRFTWYHNTSGQESKPAPAGSITVSSGKILQVTTPVFPMGVPYIRVYASETQGSEVLQGSSSTKIWIEPVTGLVTGTASPPSSNTLRPALKWSLIGELETTKVRANRYQAKAEFLEVII